MSGTEEEPQSNQNPQNIPNIRPWRAPGPELERQVRQRRDRESIRHREAQREIRELNRLAQSRRRHPTRDLLTEHPFPWQERINLEGFTNLEPNTTKSFTDISNTANLTIRICLDNYPALDIWNHPTQQYISIGYPDVSDTRIPREHRILLRTIHRSFLDANGIDLPWKIYVTYSDSDSNTEE